MSDISSVVDEYLCHSCGACFNVCKHGAIGYHETVGGYYFPKIDVETCNKCGLCYEVCPGIKLNFALTEEMSEDPFVGQILSCKIGRASDEEIFRNAQSGGVTTALLSYLFETEQIKAAIVATMKKTTPPRGRALLTANVQDLLAAQKSKYVPIPILAELSRLKDIGSPIAFVGLPCHMHGLNNIFEMFPKIRKSVLIKIGLICDRAMTYASIDFIGRKATSLPITNLIFRDKQRPSYPGNPVVTTEDGKEIILDASLRMAIKDFFTPARCMLCFDKMNIFSDVVCGDPHGIQGFDLVNGETLCLVRTENGERLIKNAEGAKAITMRSAPTQMAIEGQFIEHKRTAWQCYMAAWGCMRKKQPSIPFTFIKTELEDTTEYEASLENSLRLDKYATRSELLDSAEEWLSKQDVNVFYRRSASIMKRIRRKIRKAG